MDYKEYFTREIIIHINDYHYKKVLNHFRSKYNNCDTIIHTFGEEIFIPNTTFSFNIIQILTNNKQYFDDSYYSEMISYKYKNSKFNNYFMFGGHNVFIFMSKKNYDTFAKEKIIRDENDKFIKGECKIVEPILIYNYNYLNKICFITVSYNFHHYDNINNVKHLCPFNRSSCKCYLDHDNYMKKYSLGKNHTKILKINCDQKLYFMNFEKIPNKQTSTDNFTIYERDLFILC